MHDFFDVLEWNVLLEQEQSEVDFYNNWTVHIFISQCDLIEKNIY